MLNAGQCMHLERPGLRGHATKSFWESHCGLPGVRWPAPKWSDESGKEADKAIILGISVCQEEITSLKCANLWWRTPFLWIIHSNTMHWLTGQRTRCRRNYRPSLMDLGAAERIDGTWKLVPITARLRWSCEDGNNSTLASFQVSPQMVTELRYQWPR